MRILKSTPVLLLMLLSDPAAAAQSLSTRIAAIASRVDAKVGVAAIDLDTGRTASLNADQPYPLASVYKLPLAIEVLHQVDAKRLSLDHSYTLKPSDFSLGHSPVRDAANGKPVTMTLRELITTAVADSDNTSADYMLRIVTPKAVTARMKTLHADGIRVDRPENDIIPTFSTPEGVARYAVGPRDTATPLSAAALLGVFHRKREGLSAASHAFLAELLGPKSKNPVRIAKLLPKGATVAHKTGTMPGTMNDAGIITSADGKHHIAIAIMKKGAKKSSEADREKVIADIARLVYDEWVR
jgi:beta-lactamase class A